MGWHYTKFAWLGFQTLWLLFVLPGHTRGLISWVQPKTVSDPTHAQVDSCCAVRVSTDVPPDGKPTREQQKNCAVCYYVVGLMPPPVMDLSIPDLGLLTILPLIAPHDRAEQEHLLTYYACGPPVC